MNLPPIAPNMKAKYKDIKITIRASVSNPIVKITIRYCKKSETTTLITLYNNLKKIIKHIPPTTEQRIADTLTTSFLNAKSPIIIPHTTVIGIPIINANS